MAAQDRQAEIADQSTSSHMHWATRAWRPQRIVTGTFSAKFFSALAQLTTSGWLSVSLKVSVNRTARSNVTR
jgi:hypothetical protein